MTIMTGAAKEGISYAGTNLLRPSLPPFPFCCCCCSIFLAETDDERCPKLFFLSPPRSPFSSSLLFRTVGMRQGDSSSGEEEEEEEKRSFMFLVICWATKGAFSLFFFGLHALSLSISRCPELRTDKQFLSQLSFFFLLLLLLRGKTSLVTTVEEKEGERHVRFFFPQCL